MQNTNPDEGALALKKHSVALLSRETDTLDI